ncbi:site-specific DNA-methyltransferase [Pseudomonas daroniae]|uniref:Methyltransferase n=1 Tax=Phytopseudomonas daroniae TaxID=2487519 RepID=A0A4Q9QMM8_9GAMM|nr:MULTISPECIES: DNA methyltransferase [Pseudomonas]TBU79811.1 site-specific DNA-methyltransferase [Pseudomonas daroniae]TBU82470.1 site-specific DNA-methyltransferase [Pseudomonas sp. FRB 228]TBU91817.1 site-specific DNA-methyltransferase [Pseudomonas daroniae]
MIEANLTLKEVAAYLKVSLSTVRRLIRNGELQSFRIGTQGQVRVPESAVKRMCGAEVAEPVLSRELENSAKSSIAVVDAQAEVRILSGSTREELRWSILHADVNAAAAKLPAESVNCVVTSPPYYWQRDYEVGGQIGHEPTIEGYVDALVEVFSKIKKSLTPDGTLFLNLGDTYYSAKGKPHGTDEKHKGRNMMRKHLRAVDGPGLGLPRKSLIGIPWRVALAMQDDGWTLRSSIIWQRPATLPEPTARDRPWRTHENIFVFSKGPKYYFNRNALQGEEDIWKIIARPENPGSHFAPYPRELVDRCLACGCPEGGTVLDPFVGSGTTIVSALASGRHGVGIELKPEYAEFAAKRIKKEFGELATAKDSA